MNDTSEILARTGITYRQLDHWTRRGWLHPDHPLKGCGSRREWTNNEIEVAARMAQLVKAGLTPKTAADVARKGGEVWLTPRIKLMIDP